MNQHIGTFQARFAVFLEELEHFQRLMKRNGAISNEVHEIFAQVDKTKYESGLLRMYADQVSKQLKDSTPEISIRNRET